MATPNGLTPFPSNARVRDYVVAPGDGRTYAVGDPVALAGGSYSGPVLGGGSVSHLPLAVRWTSGPLLGSVVEVRPADRGLYIAEAAASRTAYVHIRVCDDPAAEFEVVCNNGGSMPAGVAGNRFPLVAADGPGARSAGYLDVAAQGNDMLVTSVLDNTATGVVRAVPTQHVYAGYTTPAPAGTPGTVVCDWLTGGTLALSGSAGTTAVADTTNTIAGRPSLRVTLGAAGTLQATFTFTTPITLGQLKRLQVPMMFSRNTSDDGSTQVLAAPTFWFVGTSGSQWRYACPTTGWRSGAWRTWSVLPGTATQGWSFSGSPVPTTTTSMDTDTITQVRLVYVVNAVDAGEVLWLGPLMRGARRQGVVSVVLDGAYTSQKNYVFPMLRAQGLRASMALVNSEVGGSGVMTWADIAAQYSDGHNVLHHTFDGTKTGGYVNATQWPTQASIAADVAAGFADMAARGLTRGIGYGVWGYSLPYAHTTPKVRQDMVTAGVKAGGMRAMRVSSVSGGFYDRLQPISHPDYIDPLQIQGAIQISVGNTAQQVKDVVDRARDAGEWGIITVHRSVISGPGSLEMTNADCDDWISYLGAQVRLGAVACTPFDEVCQQLGVRA